MQQNGSLSFPQDLHGPIRVAAQRKTNAYKQTYADNQNISFLPAIMSTSNHMHCEFLSLFLQAHWETEAHFSSSYWTLQSFFASQSRSKYKIIFFFSGDVNYEANFSFFNLLHKRAKPIAPPYVERSSIKPKGFKGAFFLYQLNVLTFNCHHRTDRRVEGLVAEGWV